MAARANVSTPAVARRWVGLGIAGLAGAAWCTAVAFVDPARTALAPPCPFKLLTGADCPLCGATRATHQLLHAHIGQAVDLNALYVVALPLIVWMLVAGVFRQVSGRHLPTVRFSRPVLAAFGALLIVFTVVRNLPVGPGRYLHT